MFSVAVAWSFSDSVAICYVLPSGFVDDVRFSYHGASMPESSKMLCLEEVCQLPVTIGRQITAEFG